MRAPAGAAPRTRRVWARAITRQRRDDLRLLSGASFPDGRARATAGAENHAEPHLDGQDRAAPPSSRARRARGSRPE